MYYYSVSVGSQKYRGFEFLTYSSRKLLKPGSIVRAELRHEEVIGIIIAQTTKPEMATKPILDVLDLGPLPSSSLRLLDWLTSYYPSPIGTLSSLFLLPGLEKTSSSSQPTKTNSVQSAFLPKLTGEQSQVMTQINRLEKPFSLVLHGNTGTGKTRIYLELAKKSLANGKNVLVLTPEISLTPQLVNDFEKYISEPVIVLHSNLTNKQRRQAWSQIINSKEALVVIGPRSALFAPFNNLGLAVVDEMHEPAYKQEQSPHYNALRVAAQLAKIHGANLVMGSATPNITDYYSAKSKLVPIVRMTKLATPASLVQTDTKIKLIPYTDKTLFTKNRYLSNDLIDAIEQNLAKARQSIVFLNRRGSARQILCQSCGWQALCPNCDLPLTYHGDSHKIRCHTCGYSQAAPTECPVCQGLDITYRGVGTKTIAQELKVLFPKARVLRFDKDNKKSERLEAQFKEVTEGCVDILVGTQLLVKGLDLPKLATVGVVSADTSLGFPDYTSAERTFQLISQLLGRVGRGHVPGNAIIQTYQPENPVINAAIGRDWLSFYKVELAERDKFMFPPFCYLLKLSCTRASQQSAKQAATKFIQELKNRVLKIKILGPSPAFYEKSSKGYTWQIVVKSKDRKILIELVKSLPSGWTYDIDPSNLL